MDIIKSIVGCITGRDNQAESLVNEKADPNHTDEDRRTAQTIATDVLNVLCTAEKNGRDLKRTLQDIVGEYGWTEKIATAILNGLEKILKNGASMAQAMKDAFQRATNAAEAFAREHPVYCTVIALGILVILAPWVIEALGFGELGPIEGNFGFPDCCVNGKVVLTQNTLRDFCCLMASEVCRLCAKGLSVFVLPAARDDLEVDTSQ
jgi:hypothetical protein